MGSSVTLGQYCLLGLPFDAVRLDEAAAIIADAIDKQTPCLLSTPNLNFTVMAQEDPDFYQSVIHSDLVIADGMPLVWVARLLNLPIHERVAGSDLFAYLSNQSRTQKIRVFFFGGEKGIAEQAHHQLNKTSRGMESCGFYDPGFVSIEQMSGDSVIEHINTCRPDFIVVALGAKKGQQWIMHNRQKLNAPVISHLGAVINFVAGNVKRAPEKWQHLGLEWLWRIRQEPKLYKRYLGDGLRFLRMLFSQTLPLAIQLKRLEKQVKDSYGEILTDAVTEPEKFIISLRGNIVAEQMQDWEQVLQSALASHHAVVIEGAGIRYLSLSTIARLLRFQGQLQRQQNSMILKDFPADIVAILRMSSVLPHFQLI